MTAPVPYPTGWLQLADVKDQLRVPAGDATDDVLIQACIDATEPEVCRARPDALPDPAAVPDAYRGAVMLAARLVRRRNSPAGVETFAASVRLSTTGDAELDRLLRAGPSRMPGVG